MHETYLLVGGLFVWTAAAAAFAASGLMIRLPPIAIPAMIWTLALSTLAVFRWVPGARQALENVDLGWAFALQALRAPVGGAFILLGGEGWLDPAFVRVAGPGDIVAGVGALVAWRAWRSWQRGGVTTRSGAWWLVMGWNVFGLADILLVMFTAQRILFFGGGVEAMSGFFLFPLPMIPSWLVPLVLLTHLWIFARLWARRT